MAMSMLRSSTDVSVTNTREIAHVAHGDLVESQGTLLSGLFSKTQATPLPVFATLIKDGKVLMGVKPKE